MLFSAFVVVVVVVVVVLFCCDNNMLTEYFHVYLFLQEKEERCGFTTDIPSRVICAVHPLIVLIAHSLLRKRTVGIVVVCSLKYVK